MYAVFTCSDCGTEVSHSGPHDGNPVCLICRWIREVPYMSEDMKLKLRGLKVSGGAKTPPPQHLKPETPLASEPTKKTKAP
jgi:hypothetical protein